MPEAITPENLANMAPKKLTKWMCSLPWQQVIIDVFGNVMPCCHWPNKPCGNVNDQPLEKIWNGPAFRRLRAGIARGDLAAAGCSQCSIMQQKLFQSFFGVDEFAEGDSPYARHLNENLQEYLDGCDKLQSHPTRISYSGTAACNLRCYYCYQNNHKHLKLDESVWQSIEKLLPTCSEIIWGGGEPFIQKELFTFIENHHNYPQIKFSTTTNGNVLTEEILTALEGFSQVNIHFSIDAATSETYHSHRVGGNWEKLVRNLQMAVEYRNRNLDRWSVSWGFLAMKSNIHEMALAIEKAAELTIPISLSPIVSYPLEERLDKYCSYREETKDYEQYFSEAREAIKKHQQAIEKLIDDDERYLKAWCNPVPNIEFMEDVVRSAKQPHYVTVEGCLRETTEASPKKTVVLRYNTDVSSYAGYSVVDADGTFSLEIPKGHYYINAQEWHSYGDNLVPVSQATISHDAIFDISIKRGVRQLPKKSRITYKGTVRSETDSAIAVVLRRAKTFEEVAVIPVDRDTGSFEADITRGYYGHSIEPADKLGSTSSLFWLNCLDFTRDREYHIKVQDGGGYFHSPEGENIPLSDLLVSADSIDDEQMLEDAPNSESQTGQILFVGNIANNSYNNVKFLRRKGFEADAITYDYFHIMGQPEWEDAVMSGPPLDEMNPDFSTVNLNGYESPEWFTKTALTSFYEKSQSDEPRKSFSSSFASMVAWVGNRTPIRHIPKYWGFYNWLARRSTVQASKNRIQHIVSEYRRLVPKAANPFPLEAVEVEDFLLGAKLHKAMYSGYKGMVLCDTNPIWALFQDKPFIAYEHGTLRDFPFEDTTLGKLLALAYHKAAKVVITNCDNIEAAKKLNLTNYTFIPHPVDTEKVCKKQTPLYDELRKKHNCQHIIFAPARHNWKPEAGKGLSVYKGTDRMVLALRKLIDDGIDVKMIFCDWGQEQDLTRQLIDDQKLENEVIWVHPMAKLRLLDYYNAADVVLDQFSIGTFGTTAVEAIACEKPVLIYLRPEIHSWCFPEMPPMINVRQPEEIYAACKRLLEDKSYAQTVGRRGRKWVEQYHSWEIVADRLLESITEVLL